MTPQEIAQEFERLHLEEWKTRKRIPKSTAVWDKIKTFCDANCVTPLVFFTTLFRWQKSTGKKPRQCSVNFYGSDFAFELFTRLASKRVGATALTTERDKVVNTVRQGLRVLLAAHRQYKCGLLARRMAAAHIPVTLFAVDDYWHLVADTLPAPIVAAVNNERYRLMHNPELWKAAKETYYGWQQLTPVA